MTRIATAAALCLALAAPASAELTQRQRDIATYAALSLADATITYAAMERGHQEANPLMRFAGDEAWQVAGSVLVVSGFVGWTLDRIGQRRGHDHRAWSTANLVRAFTVGWNAKVMTEGE